MKIEREKIGKGLISVVLILAMMISSLLQMSISMAKTENSHLYSEERADSSTAGKDSYEPDQMQDYSLSEIKQMNASDEEFDFMMSEEGYLEELYGTYSDITVDSWEAALYSLYNIKTLLGIDNPFEELELQECYHDDSGYSYCFRQVNKGEPVSDRGLVISCNGQRKINMLSSSYLNMETIKLIEQREIREKYLGILENILILIAVAIWFIVTVLTFWRLFRREGSKKENEEK